jgi:hypothetical protein
MATIFYTGAAASVSYKCDLTIGGTWAASDTVTVSINSRDLTINVGTTSYTTAAVATKIWAAFSAGRFDDNLQDNESRNLGGQEVSQFGGLQATVSGSVVSFFGPPGVPYTLAFSETSSSGTVSGATVQAATGSAHWDNGDNWSASAVPTNGNKLWFDHRAGGRSCQYGLPASGDGLEIDELHVTEGFTGMIGLPATNNYSGRPYSEYRERYLVLTNDALERTDIMIGEKDNGGSGPRLVNIEHVGDTAVNIEAAVVVRKTGNPLSGERAAVNLELDKDTNFNYVTVEKGTVAIDDRPQASSAGSKISQLVVLSGGDVYLGPDVTFATVGPRLSVTGGKLYAECQITEDITLRDATTVLKQGVNAKILNVYGGTCAYSLDTTSVVPSAINQSGTISFEGSCLTCDISAKPWTAYAGATIWDRSGAITYPAISCPNGIETVTINLGGGATVKPAN